MREERPVKLHGIDFWRRRSESTIEASYLQPLIAYSPNDSSTFLFLRGYVFYSFPQTLLEFLLEANLTPAAPHHRLGRRPKVHPAKKDDFFAKKPLRWSLIRRAGRGLCKRAPRRESTESGLPSVSISVSKP